jgi:hypothetical protein
VVTHDYLRSWLDKAWKKQVPSVGIPRHEPLSRFSFAQPPPTQIPIVQIGVQLLPLPHLKYIFSLHEPISPKIRLVSTCANFNTPE